MKSPFAALLLLSVFVFSCNTNPIHENQKKDNNTETEVKSLPDNSFNSLNWQGLYEGILPNEEGGQEVTTLDISKNHTYTLKRRGVINQTAEVVLNGVFQWDESGSKIYLKVSEDEDLCFLVGEEALFLLDKSGKRLKDTMLQDYQLRKAPADGNLSATAIAKPITETKWLLVELMGKPVEKSLNYHIVLGASNNRLSAFAGCNRMGGPYQITENNSIHFGELISTKMACADMEAEERLSEVLKKVNRYDLKGNSLRFFRGETGALARFEAE